MGWHKSYVTELKKAGRLVMTADGKHVKVTASINRIKETSDPNRDDVKSRHSTARGQDSKIDEIGKPVKPPKVKSLDEISFSTGRAKEQHFKALQAELEYKKTIIELVNTKDMQAAVADVVTTFRQALENMPPRLASDLVGKDMDFIRASLKQECHSILANLSRDFNEKIEKQEGTAT